MLGGSALAFGIVLFADMRGSRERADNMVIEQARFSKVMAHQSGRVRRIDIAVEWQQINATQQVMETSLLVRRYGLDENGNEVQLPVERVRIPKNLLSVDGMMLEFGDRFSGEYQNLRRMKLAYFSRIYGPSELIKDRFTLMEDGRVPSATQMHIGHVTYYELKLWKYLWYLIQNPKQAKTEDVTVTMISPKTWAVSNGAVYSVFVGFEGVTYAENNDPAVLGDILQEAAKLDEEEAEGKPSL